MITPEFQATIEMAAHELLVWVGFGTLAGLAGKIIMPGRDPGGAVGTLCMGITGSVIGCGTLALVKPDIKITPISPLGFLCATGGVFVLLLFYRILSNSYIVEAVDGNVRVGPHGEEVVYRRNRRRRVA